MSYSVLIFDADGTLFDFDEAEKQAFHHMLEEFDIIPTDELFESYLQENKRVWTELEEGKISLSELKLQRFLGFITVASLSGDAKSYATSYMTHLSEQSILFPGALELIQELSNNYTLTILTNGLKEVQHKRIRQSVLAPYITDVVISDELGITKPDPAIISHALSNINHQTLHDVMIIGDSLTSDIQGGQNASITTVWFNKEKKTNTTTIKPDYEIHTLSELLSLLKN